MKNHAGNLSVSIHCVVSPGASHPGSIGLWIIETPFNKNMDKDLFSMVIWSHLLGSLQP